MYSIKFLNVFWEQSGFSIPVCLVRGEASALVDTGPPQASRDYLLEELSKEGLTPETIDFAIITHGHGDHMGGNAKLLAAGKTRFLVHEDDAVRLEDPAAAFDRFQAPLLEALGKTSQEINAERPRGQGIPVDRKIKDGEAIDLGGVSLTAVHLPGHTDGSMGLFLEKDGVMFIGDSVSGFSTDGGIFPIITDLDAYKNSVRKLQNLPISRLVTSHPYRGSRLAASTERSGAELKEFLDDSLLFVQRFEEIVERLSFSQAETLPQKTDKIIAEMPAEMSFLPLSKVNKPNFSLTTVFWTLRRLGK